MTLTEGTMSGFKLASSNNTLITVVENALRRIVLSPATNP